MPKEEPNGSIPIVKVAVEHRVGRVDHSREAQAVIQKWINSEGGPLVLANTNDLAHWNGIFLHDAEATSDYDRACAIDKHLDLLCCNGRQFLVLGDEPMSTSCLMVEGHTLIIRWIYAQSEQHVLAASPSFITGIELCDLRVELGGEYLLFDSASPGTDILGERLNMRLVPGIYRILTRIKECYSLYSVVVHQFLLVQQI